ncbi:small-conductance mechanosensitive channel [Corticibacter populi]|nr:small-conductance mechanosensitive channel [Corticibacter populi]
MFAVLFLSSLLLATMQAFAQQGSAAGDVLDGARQSLQQIRQELPKIEDDEGLDALRRQGLQTYEELNAYTASLTPRRDDISARLAELGEAPAGEESAEIATQREQLNEALLDLDTESRLAGLLKLDLEQTLADLAAQRRALFQAQLWQRSPSILTGRFWSELTADPSLDAQRGQVLLDEMRAHFKDMPGWLWWLLPVWAVVIVLLQRRLRLRLMGLAARKVPSGRLRRCSYAWSQVALAVTVPFVLLGGIYLAFTWLHPLPESLRHLFLALIGAVSYGGYAAGLWHALLAPHSPSWRLPPIGDAAASALRNLPLVLAGLLVGNWLARQLCALVNARLGAVILVDAVFALLMIGLLVTAVVRVARAQRQQPEPAAAGTGTWVAGLLRRYQRALRLAFGLALLVASVSLLSGFVAFAQFLLQQLIWSLVILATAYLLSATIGDVAAVLTGRTAADDAAEADQNATGGLVGKKWVVLGAGLAQASVALLAVLLLFASYGSDPLNIGLQVQHLRSNFSWGEVQLRPMAIIQGLLLFLVGIGVVHVVKQWTSERLLPVTSLEPSVQASLSTLAGYVGYVVVIATALSATGLGFEKVTWIASALSVGIGFGLQAIVQNFVSGIILLAERPVKVGDWVSLGGIEGDIRRINVRATEIQMSDRSTVIMPNSEFVTKMVRNVTYADSLGRVQIKLPMPLDAPASRVRQVILDALDAHPLILATPAPGVYLDDVGPSGLMFNALAYVSSPRQAYGARSALLYDILERLAKAGIATSSPSTLILAQPKAAAVPPAPGQAESPAA